jgi:sirohydrochlorin ferrochelatase
MMAYSRTRATGAMLVLLSAQAAAGAQDKCQINDSSPYQVNGARQYVLQAANSRRDDEVPKHLRNAVRVLTDAPEKINNEAGRQYLLLRTYAQFLKRDDASYTMKRGDVGFTQNPTGAHNLLLAIDSAVTTIEKMMPSCASTVRPYRDQFSGEIYNKAVEMMSADQNDSSVYFAKLAMQMASTDPRPWNLLSAVYQKQEKMDSAKMAMERVISMAGSDTLYAKVKQQSRYNLAVINLSQAEAASGAEKDQQISAARGLLEAYLKETPGDANATQALGRAMRLSGDTAAVANMLAEMEKNAANFTADQLFEAASNAAAGGRDKDAAGLFEAGLAKNPYHRNALYNYANVLFSLKDTEKMGVMVQRLMQIDPNFERGWRLVAGYWQLRSRAETDAARKKLYNDSTLFYLERQTKTNPKIEITAAGKSGNNFTVGGVVTNGGEASGSWTMKLELLDQSGEVVATKDVALGPVDAGSGTTFSITIDEPKAVAFRYAPLK